MEKFSVFLANACSQYTYMNVYLCISSQFNVLLSANIDDDLKLHQVDLSVVEREEREAAAAAKKRQEVMLG